MRRVVVLTQLACSPLPLASSDATWRLGRCTTVSCVAIPRPRSDSATSAVDLPGKFEFDTKLFDPAEVEIVYREGVLSLGGRIGIAEGTVKTHVLRLYDVLEVTNRTEAAMRMRELGIAE